MQKSIKPGPVVSANGNDDVAIDCVLGYHMNPLTCGIARFNQVLAERLGVPHVQVFDPAVSRYKRPLLSIKTGEFSEKGLHELAEIADSDRPGRTLDLFLHAYAGTVIEERLLRATNTVYCGNVELAAQLRNIHSNVVEAWCPGALFDRRTFENTEISVFSFGMAHKLRADYYGRLNDLLNATGKSYSLYLSTALHEGTSFEEEFSEAYEQMQTFFDGEIYFLGFLSDGAVYNQFRSTTYFATFFDRGVRANNTSVNIAMECGSVIITNLDAYSPPSFRHLENVVDIQKCDVLPTDTETLDRIGKEAQGAAQKLGWDGLIDLMPH